MRYEIRGTQIFFAIESIKGLATVQEFLDKYIPSRKQQHLLYQKKRIFLDQEVAKRESFLQGNYLILPLYEEKGSHFPPQRQRVAIPYRDPFLLVAYKEAGLLVHSDGEKEISLTELLQGQRREKLQAIHRLDKDTCGLVLFSRSPLFQSLFDKMMQEREISREYIAIVQGRIKKGSHFSYQQPIGRDRHNARKMRLSRAGKSACTEVIGLGGNGEVSVVSCHLQTGRTHQIRVHFAGNAHPLLGDELYGKKDERGLALFATRLRFYHPFLEKEILVEAPLPSTYENLYAECIHK